MLLVAVTIFGLADCLYLWTNSSTAKATAIEESSSTAAPAAAAEAATAKATHD